MNSYTQRGLVAAMAASLFCISGSASALMVPRAFTASTGVEITYNIDTDANYNFVSGASLFADGNGNVADAYDYPVGGGNVDALANRFDLYFDGILNGTAALLAGTTGDTTNYLGKKTSVMALTPDDTLYGWATPADLQANPNIPRQDLDSLEVWGPNGVADANMYSVQGDTGGVAIWDLNGGAPTAFLTSNELRNAIKNLATGGPLPDTAFIDLDALMVNGNRVLFTIRPIGSYFDGGEIFYYEVGSGGQANFLTFAGHVWNTGFNAGTHLGCKAGIQDIDILEAVDLVPEPASMAVLGLGALGLLRRRRPR